MAIAVSACGVDQSATIATANQWQVVSYPSPSRWLVVSSSSAFYVGNGQTDAATRTAGSAQGHPLAANVRHDIPIPPGGTLCVAGSVTSQVVLFTALADWAEV